MREEIRKQLLEASSEDEIIDIINQHDKDDDEEEEQAEEAPAPSAKGKILSGYSMPDRDRPHVHGCGCFERKSERAWG